MKKSTLNIHIFGRKFPLRAEPGEATAIQEAARRINAQIDSYESIYGTQDDLNIALMCCLKFATDQVKAESEGSTNEGRLKQHLAALEAEIADLLPNS